MNAVHLTTTINTLMKILEIITEATPAVPDPKLDPDAYLKWWMKNKPKGMAVYEEPKGSWWTKAKANRAISDALFRVKYGNMFTAIKALGILEPLWLYHVAMTNLNDDLVANKITPAEAVEQRNRVAGYTVYSLLLPTIIAALTKATITSWIGWIFRNAASVGGKAGGKVTAIVALGETAVVTIASILLASEAGRKWLAEVPILNYVIFGMDMTAGMIGEYATALIDWCFDKLPKEWQDKYNQTAGTAELQTAIDKEKQAEKDVSALNPDYETRKINQLQGNTDMATKYLQQRFPGRY